MPAVSKELVVVREDKKKAGPASIDYVITGLRSVFLTTFTFAHPSNKHNGSQEKKDTSTKCTRRIHFY